MKKVLALLLAIIMTAGISTSVFAGEYDENEQYIIEQLSDKNFPVELEQQYINQLKNYFYQDDVKVEKSDAEEFISYLKAGLLEKEEADRKKNVSLDEQSSIYQNFQKAGTLIGLLFEYDSKVNSFYAIDESGYIVIDSVDIIKNTGSSEDGEGWNISIELIFAFVIILCILGILANLKRWNKKMKHRSSKNYEGEDEDDDELEVANRKTRKARLQTWSYKSVKQVLRYFYIPIIMGLIIVGIGYAVINRHSDIIESISTNFVNTQPLYNRDEEAFVPADETKSDTVELSDISWPKYGKQYGILQCEKLNIDASVYFGDRGELLKNGVGTYIGSSIPGQNGTILIGGHDTTLFKGLEKVKKGDSFTFTTEYGVYKYKVTDTKIYDEEDYDKAYDLSSKKEQLVLYTCYPFGVLNGTKTERMFVYLDKVSGPDIVY